MLALKRKTKQNARPGERSKSRVNFYRGDELVGFVDVRHASFGFATLHIDMPKDVRVIREECECQQGSSGKEAA
jgi:hypothetical protein